MLYLVHMFSAGDVVLPGRYNRRGKLVCSTYERTLYKKVVNFPVPSRDVTYGTNSP